MRRLKEDLNLGPILNLVLLTTDYKLSELLLLYDRAIAQSRMA